MQSASSSGAQPEAILEWLQKEMGYRPQGPYYSSNKAMILSVDTVRKIYRGNMVPVWSFLLQRVKSEKTVEKIRRNILVHGSSSDGGLVDSAKLNEEGKSKGRRKEKEKVKLGLDRGLGSDSSSESREIALRERELAEKEVERLRHIVRRQRKELRARMLDLSREEAERKRMLDERSNCRHKQVMLEAYDQQCDEATRIFAEYQKRLQYYINQARDAQRSSVNSAADAVDDLHLNGDKEAVYSTVKGNKSLDDVFIETTWERDVRKACESLAAHMIEKICSAFPAYEGSGIHLNPQLEVAKLSIDFDGEIPDDVKAVVLNCLKNPPQLLQAITTYTLHLKTLVSRETEKIDIRADAELLRYKFENNRVTDASSPDANLPLQYQLYDHGKMGSDISTKGTHSQLLERQKAHVQQFVATEDALNKAAEARNLCQKFIKCLHGSNDAALTHALAARGTSQSVASPRQFELEVWAKEREAAGLRASLNTLTSEVLRLNKLCAEWNEAEDSLRKKWKKIDEFDARRSELESIYTALLRANMDAAAFWNQQSLAAREYASSTIIPACSVVVEIANSAKDLIEKEVSAFYQGLDNSLYMLPSTPQALLESMGASGSTAPEAVAIAEKNASLLTARVGVGDPSAIPSICRIAAALQHYAGLEGSDAGLASVLESLEFCLKLRGSEASVLDELSKAINLVQRRRDLVDSGHTLLNHASRAQQEYERTTTYCLNLAAEQENTIMEKWLPELKTAVVNAQTCLEDCKRVRGLVDEWWEQPAATVIDWVTVDGQNVSAWLNRVKQLQMAFYDKELL
ncbi:AUGMIN subunit 5-like [Telopea speciosissima]|uniref:AUGMIN subunit 5-like n=1 Tax=Telopea speciosissima TaxID=54955 RepID=UPI001CC54D22|nr:AUGMIN subunit 5-like [Telopea speciosissima]